MVIVHALIITFIFLADLFLLVPKYTRCKYDHTPRVKKLVWKGACIGLPLLVLVFETVLKSLTGEAAGTDYLLVLGMVLCAFGDIVLEIRFVKGGFLFFAGHMVYVITLFLMQNKVSIISVVCYVVLVCAGTVLTVTKLSKKYRPLLIGYNLIISGSFAMALPLILSFDSGKVLLGVGACGLVVSDWLLARNKTYGSNFNRSLVSLMFYFGGQILISAYSFLS